MKQTSGGRILIKLKSRSFSLASPFFWQAVEVSFCICSKPSPNLVVRECTAATAIFHLLQLRAGIMASRKTLIAVAQLTSKADMLENVRIISALAAEAVKRGAKLLFLPECANFFGDEQTSGSKVLEPLNGSAIAQYRELAQQHRLWLSLGGFQERAKEAGKGHNTHVVIDDAGSLAAVYRKAHLFDLELPSIRLKESDHTAPGDALVVCDSPAGRLGLSVCYDVRFPEMYRSLSSAGAQILTVPAAFTVPTGSAHWELLLRARAVENQCYVVASAQVGAHNNTRTSYGHSMIIDPWGTVLAQAGGPEAAAQAPCIITAEVDLDFLDDVRRRMPVASHCRPPLYASKVLLGRQSLIDADGAPLAAIPSDTNAEFGGASDR